MLVEDWGLIPYQEAFLRQEQYVQDILAQKREETLVFCSHPPVVTLGRGTKPGDVFSWQGETIEVNRGGRATYHGPSQIIFYPLISLDFEPSTRKIRPRDLHQYMRALEESVMDVLKEFGVESEGRSTQTQVGEEVPAEATGVWVKGQKIASIGIAVKKWIASHGVAVNLYQDAQAFQGMNPCGFKTSQMTDLETLTGKQVPRDQVLTLWKEFFLKRFFN